MTVWEKYEQLLGILRTMEGALLAFSGGVDSTLLLVALAEANIRWRAVTALSATFPNQDLQDVQWLVEQLRVDHVYLDSEEMKDENFLANPPDRCFYCKSNLFAKLTALARTTGFAVVLDGSTTDDTADYRPGTKAKQHFAVRSPLQEAGLNKEEVRSISQAKGLRTWNKPASPCLSSRIPYGEPIELRSLQMVEQAETLLQSLGFHALRVRKQGETARIELSLADIPKLLDPTLRENVVSQLRTMGFECVALDLEGFKSGKLNRSLAL